MSRLEMIGAILYGSAIAGGVLAVACTGESNSPLPFETPQSTAGTSNAGRGGSDSDAGGTEPRGGAPALADAGNVGRADAGSGDPPRPSVPAGCPTPSPVPVENQRIAIQSINFDTSEIVLRNVSNEDVTIPGGAQGWPWCNVPAYGNIAAANVTLSPGETFAFLPVYGTRVRPFFPGDDSFEPNELGIYTGSGSFDESELMLAFVSWGLGAQLETREYVATLAELWNYGERIPIDPGDSGFIATGPTNRGSGYTSVPARCLVAPENEAD